MASGAEGAGGGLGSATALWVRRSRLPRQAKAECQRIFVHNCGLGDCGSGSGAPERVRSGGLGVAEGVRRLRGRRWLLSSLLLAAAPLLWTFVGAHWAFAPLAAIGHPGAVPQHGSPERRLSLEASGGRPRRREAAALLLTGGTACSGGGAALASNVDLIVGEMRKKAEQDKKSPSIWNPDSYKVPTGLYNSTNLRGFLPTVYLSRRAFEGLRRQLLDPRANLTDPLTFDGFRVQNREKPIKDLRKEAFRTKTWVEERLPERASAANAAFERLKRALDTEDVQLLSLSRSEMPRVDPGSVKVTQRNVDSVLDSLDQLLDILPEKEQDWASKVASRRIMVGFKVPMSNRTRAIPVASVSGASASSAGNSAGNGTNAPSTPKPVDAVAR
mmetsp:Transcript_94921/g.268057  ORF Transcript_94921/g.268057 Transcript_94921/m.268057 type:complete len:387 (-) Transcript_94921:62-1222(-)